ncbi:MAG: MBL fold metallo-hydrolase [Ignavibacteriales bacterium]|nr:MBL fold metallo-hydrolase [Ignavibacteriales bacterium]MCF8306691.1 MBL fold metallo-hydrolase [Ignavibacteriales bacterium]MCF8316209.1 MBL fold metallo-hydrolase [Ignavibacteriales bacterium]MCF8437793.1 MBL fold metallo-hydrolase [Ignavibacteriales bacterium]
MPVTFLPLGGAGEVGANCNYFNFEGLGIIVDAGMHPRKEGLDALPLLGLIENDPVDFIIITHAHHDHIGSLPVLIKKFPHARVICSEATREIAGIVLHNSVEILKWSSHDETNRDLIYGHDDIDRLTAFFIDLHYEQEFELDSLSYHSTRRLTVTLYDAGHILGSASVLLQFGDFRLFVTGDIKPDDQIILKGAVIPDKPVDIIISESTYGDYDKDFFSLPHEIERFTTSLNSVISGGGSAMVPVFSLGKTQEMLMLVNKLMEKGKLPEVPVYTGGISRKINRIYDNFRYKTNRKEKNIELMSFPQTDIYEVTDFSDFERNNGIVLAPGGMVEKGTMSFRLTPYWLKNEKFAIFFAGYIDPDSSGFVVANASQGDKLKLTRNGMMREVKCRIERFKFPSHPFRGELFNIYESLKPSAIVLVHGSQEAVDNLGSKILNRFPGIKLYAAAAGKAIFFNT